jgi:hypothetical protein
MRRTGAGLWLFLSLRVVTAVQVVKESVFEWDDLSCTGEPAQVRCEEPMTLTFKSDSEAVQINCETNMLEIYATSVFQTELTVKPSQTATLGTCLADETPDHFSPTKFECVDLRPDDFFVLHMCESCSEASSPFCFVTTVALTETCYQDLLIAGFDGSHQVTCDAGEDRLILSKQVDKRSELLRQSRHSGHVCC